MKSGECLILKFCQVDNFECMVGRQSMIRLIHICMGIQDLDQCRIYKFVSHEALTGNPIVKRLKNHDSKIGLAYNTDIFSLPKSASFKVIQNGKERTFPGAIATNYV